MAETSEGDALEAAAPTFLIAGAARCGTTTLFHLLEHHPDIFLPANKRPEPHFFLKSAEYEKGIDYYRRRYFSNVGGARAIGEASTSYLCHGWVAERIRSAFPEIKLIVILRDPVERAWSGYWHTVKSGLETLDFDTAIRTEEERLSGETDPLMREIRPFGYVERGFYHRQIAAYLEQFPKGQLFVGLLEDLRERPDHFVNEVFDFLGVGRRDETKMISVEKRNRSAPDPAGMSEWARGYLSETYRDDTAKLARFLGKDLSHWAPGNL